MRVLIAGGGIGGLVTALCCLRFGLEPVVLERAPVLGEAGAGIQLSPNAMHVLLALGLGPALEATAVEPQSLDLRLGDSGAQVFSIPAGPEMRRRFGAPYLHIHRQDLLDVLVRTLEARAPGALQTGRELVSLRADPAGVEVLVADGGTVRGDALVGADGVRSAVRQHLLPQAAVRFTGQVAWRAVVPVARLPGGLPPELAQPRATVWTGSGCHIVTYQLRAGQALNLVAVQEADHWREESWTRQGDPQQLRAVFAGFCAPVRTVLEAVETCLVWALHDRPPLSTWCRGPVGLLGDACHAMLPFQAQGAAMAIEDAWVLAGALRDLGAIGGLRAYAARRMERTARVQAAARANARIFHRRAGLPRLLTYGPMAFADRFVPGVIRHRQDWIYGHNVVAGERIRA
jgi:salicylate hydroxylase